MDDLAAAHDEAGVIRSRTTFNDLITSEITSGVPSNRIVLGGFSQGGAMSIFTGLTTTHKLGGLFGLSAYLLLDDKIQDIAEQAGNVNKDTPWFMGHGDADPLVKYEWGKASAKALREKMAIKDLEFKTYPDLVHSAEPAEIDDLEAFLNKCIPDEHGAA